MFYSDRKPLLRCASILGAAALLATASLSAQSSTPLLDIAQESSSRTMQIDGAGNGSFGGASSENGRRPRYTGRASNLTSKLALELGAGFNAPTSDSTPYISWGGNFNLGAGLQVNKYLSLLAEYQFLGNKLPGALIAETGADGGHAHIWGFTLSPVIDLFPKRTNSIYVTGGGGFYRKVTSFTNPVLTEYCDYYYCDVGTTNEVVGHFSSNQGGWNVGAGYSHKIGSAFGTGRARLFAEARYLYVDSPASTTSPNGLGQTTVASGTRLIPVTIGIRF